MRAKTLLRPLLAASLTLLAGCGVGLGETAAPVARGSSALEGSFDAAAHEYQVPVELLKAIAYVETRVSMHEGEASRFNGFGVMQLVEREDVDTLGRAAKLTGKSRGQLKVDPAANIEGAAAVLRELFDRVAKEEPSLDARQTGDWYRAVSLYMGFESASLAAEWSADVFRTVERGFTAGAPERSVVLAPSAPAWARHAPAFATRTDALGDYPAAARYLQSPNYSAGRASYTYVVVHTTQGSYAGSVSWFQNAASNVSAHYVVRSSDGQITQMVQDQDTAWHAQCYNSKSLGIEHEGFVADPTTWYTDAMYTESAKLTRWLADTHGIPKDRTHIIGHVEVAPSCNTGGHTDPGTGWNWTKYMGLITGGTVSPSNGTLIGVIFEGGNTANRVAGATVAAGGQTVTTGADGLYQFSLPAGSTTATVTKAGYGSNTVTRTVASGAQVWGSMEINPVAAAGTLKGLVYAYNPANPGDQSQLLSGAVATVNGQSQTTGVDGVFSFSLPAGTYTVNVTLAGYQSNQAARTVTGGQTVWGSVGLSPVSAADTQAPTLTISAPTSGASLDLAAVQLAGTATDNAGAVSSVKVTLNSDQPIDVPVTSGAFALDLMLAPGANSLTVTARDGAGNTGTATATVTFRAGVAGYVYALGDQAVRIAGASVTLVEPGTAQTLAQSTTDATGAYALDVTQVGVDAIVVVKAQGFLTASETVTVPQDRRLSLPLGLVAGSDATTTVGLVFAEPQDDATVNTDTVAVYGAAKGFDLAGVSVEGVTGQLLGGNGFSATVPLALGKNVLHATATGVKGETFTAVLHVNRVAVGGTSDATAVRGGCSVGLGLEAPALLALVGLLRRRRR